MKFFLLSSFFLSMLMACSYQRPAGKWLIIDASTIHFRGVELGKAAGDPNYVATCKEAQHEITRQLSQKLPKKIAPLNLNTSNTERQRNTHAITLKLKIMHCEIDVDQYGGSFTYYLSLPINVSISRNGENLLSYNMDTYEQVTIDTPDPAFEFTFDEPVARTLLLFDGNRLWVPAN